MSGTSISFFYALVYAVWGSGVPGRWVWKGDDFRGGFGNRIARKSARFKTEGCPGTLLAKLSVVQDGRQADVCPVAWDIVWGFISLDFGCKKDIFYIEIIGFMVY